jgi:beta-phosphoglucomutase-like phosphatase (HAD superfamily)
MNIIIPLGGKGSRFQTNEYSLPKPLIKVLNKEIIFYVLDNLVLHSDDNVFIIYNNTLNNHNFCNIIKNKYPKIHRIELTTQTKGAAETVYTGINYILNNKDTIFNHININLKTILIDGDAFYTEDILGYFRNLDNELNAVFYFKNYDQTPIFSYITMDQSNIITNMKEKIKISDNANTGAYAFNNIHKLYHYSKYIVENNITFKDEPYTSCIISEMIERGEQFKGIEINNDFFFSLGTPKQVHEFIKRINVFLFDLDGTLVLTDDIYYEIWYEILVKYNIYLDNSIFKNYIQGNTDMNVIKKLLPNMNININQISELKENIFNKKIEKIKTIEGSIEFMKELKKYGNKIAIVTNCNRINAENILKKIEICDIIDELIIGNECERSKPFPDPYIVASKLFNTKSSDVFIFEDSKSGILSAKAVNPRCLIGVQTIYTKEQLVQLGVDVTIKDYKYLNYHELIKETPNYSYSYKRSKNIKEYIKKIFNNNINISENNISEKNISEKNISENNISEKNISENNINEDSNHNNDLNNCENKVKDVIIYDEKLKGGYISDVLKIEIVYSNNRKTNCVLKLENNNDKEVTNLSIMARKLGLYEREYYFYENISKYVPINIPKFYSLIKDDNLNNIGILMEDLNTNNFKINLNLNKENINISLKIIEKCALLHSYFWNKELNIIFPGLIKNNNSLFNPSWTNYVTNNWNLFKSKWNHILNDRQLLLGSKIVENFSSIQEKLSIDNLTLCHGDVKSPNIFYKKINEDNYIPYFIDWQYISHGKGIQDIVFLMIESFDIEKIHLYVPIFKNYYYTKLQEFGVNNYKYTDYETDFIHSICYYPFFVAIWFGITEKEDLIDINFPFFFIQKLFNFIELFVPVDFF